MGTDNSGLAQFGISTTPFTQNGGLQPASPSMEDRALSGGLGTSTVDRRAKNKGPQGLGPHCGDCEDHTTGPAVA